MRSDWWMLWYLLNKIRWWWASNDRGNTPAFWFDWTNDYISSNATIGRTWYDMNVSWNVTTGSDGDGSYIWINWNRDQTAWTWTRAWIWTNTVPVFNQGTSLTIKARIKFNSFAVNNVWWIFWSTADFAMNIESSTNKIRYTVRWSTNVNVDTASALSLSTPYDLYLVYDNSNTKFYAYISSAWWASTLVNAWWTTWPTTFSTDAWQLWDWAIWGWNSSSQSMYIYHAAIRNKALTQSEIDADIALWNTAKNDPSIVAYYIPDNLQYNTQYMLDPKDLSSASWSTVWWTTVTANTTVAPDWTTTADTVAIPASALNRVEQPNLTITWSALASKTFIIKAFVKVAAGTSTFRLRMTHRWVVDYQSADLTATTTRQEFTFTQTFTSSTSWTWITWAVLNGTDALVKSLQVRNVRCYLVNETLRDESPNIWGYLGRKTNKVFSCWCKPWADWTASSQSQTLFYGAWWSFYISWSTNIPTKSIVTRLWAKAHTATALGNWYRSKVHVIWTISYTWWVFAQKIYVNWVLSWSSTWSNDVPTSLFASGIINVWVNTWVYYTWNIRDARIYTFTWSFTDADALAIYNGGEPTSVWVTKYLHYKPLSWEIGTATSDLSTNLRDWTLNNWVTRTVV